jgi:phospholipase D-like protein
VVLPEAINNQLKGWFTDENRGNMVMIHSKVVLIDPFGPHPVLMTGSHNLGPKASGQNDDNLLIVENAPGLAAEYAVHILGVFDHYKFRYAHYTPPPAKGSSAAKPAKGVIWSGLQDNDTWQDGYYQAARAREIDFWFGGLQPAAPGVKPVSVIVPDRGTATPAPAVEPASAKADARKLAAKPVAKKLAAQKVGVKKPAVRPTASAEPRKHRRRPRR